MPFVRVNCEEIRGGSRHGLKATRNETTRKGREEHVKSHRCGSTYSARRSWRVTWPFSVTFQRQENRRRWSLLHLSLRRKDDRLRTADPRSCHVDLSHRFFSSELVADSMDVDRDLSIRRRTNLKKRQYFYHPYFYAFHKENACKL